ncbi:AI-2E family transporter [Lachnospiraceae bacterium 46-61]
MNHDEKMNYFWKGLILFGAISASILFFFFLFKLKDILNGFKTILNVLAPISYGLILAYILTPIYNKFEKRIEPYFIKNLSISKGKALAKAVSTSITLLLMIAVLASFFWLVFPQLYKSILGIIDLIPDSINKVSVWVDNLFENNPQAIQTFSAYYEEATKYLEQWLDTSFVSNIQSFVSNVSIGVFKVLSFLKNFLIGIIVAVYVLNCKTMFATQAKKLIYSIFNQKLGSAVINEIRFVHQVFGGFIIGKLIDSFIIGIICYICLALMNMPYSMLISVIIGVTNIIPFFGPFIGAIPSFFLLLLVSPMQSIYFLIFIFILQQFDGNILGPKILGDSTGLSSFWVLFSILFFGGLMGFFGMIIGVPFFAVAYHLISQAINNALEKKHLSTKTEDYKNIP